MSLHGTAAVHAATIELPPCFSCTLDTTPPVGETWVIQGNFVSVGVDGLVNEGTLINQADYFTNALTFQSKGILTNNTWMYNLGTLLIAGSAQTALNNSGTLWNQGTLNMYASLNNLAGRLINQGLIQVDGHIGNHAGATLINNATLKIQGGSTSNDAGGLIENAGTWTTLNGSAITNQGAVNNRGTMTGISLRNSGTFTNFAGATLNAGVGLTRIESGGKLINHGTINLADNNFELAAGSTFDFTGGTLNNNALGHITLYRDFVLGDAKSGVVNLSALGSLRNYAKLSVAKGYTQVAGGSITNQSGANFNVAGTLVSQDLFNNADARLNNTGTIDVGDVLVNRGVLTNRGTLLASEGQVINETGATLDNLGLITFGFGKLVNKGALNNGGSGATNAQITLERDRSYDFTGGTLNNRAKGILQLNAGTNFVLGATSSGVVNLSSGGRVQIDTGASMVNQAGHTQLNQGDIVAFPGGLFQNNGVLINHGKISGGQINNTGTILGNGAIELGDGNASIAGSVTQNSVTISRGGMRFQAGGSLQVNTLTVSDFEGSVRHEHSAVVTATRGVSIAGSYYFQGEGGTINGSVRNLEDGKIQVDSSHAIFNGTLTNEGRYLSSNAINSMGNLLVAETGWLAADHSSFIVAGDFLNHSTQATRWNTSQADLQLFGSGLHQLGLAGTDQGASRSGYADNFSWGTLALGTGSRYQLIDGNGIAGGALYVGLVDLQDGVTQLRDIDSNFNIYYDALLAGNAYLGGRSYAFGKGTGHLIGISSAIAAPLMAVPEPTEGALVLGGLGVLSLWSRRRRSKQH